MLPTQIVGLEDKFQEIWSCITEERVGILAITGDAGIGKTTLLRLIHDKLISTGNYNIVIWVTVSRDFQVGYVQDEIWRRIGSLNEKWLAKSLGEKAKSIYDELIKIKFVLFLDDLWNPFNLERLGVPQPRKLDESIVIISSRTERIRNQMRVHKSIIIDILSHEDAWTLFRMKVGEDIFTADPKITKLANEISMLCFGRPFLLCTVARAMACRKTYEEWKFALEEMQQNIENRLFWPQLGFCFDSLPCDAVRSCFLYFSLFPEDFTISKNDLIDFWICEEFFGYYCSKDSAIGLGCSIIDVLIRASLFEEEENDYVKMLDSIREFALDLVFDSRVFENAGLIEITDDLWQRRILALSTNMPSNKELGAGRILSMRSIIHDIPNITPDLSTFFLCRNPFVMFKNQYMPELTVLDLSRSSVEEVPRGISELVSLQHLNLSHTYIERLPIELKKLKKLRCLNLENNDQLRVIPRQVISSLSSLQVLRMFRCGFSVYSDEDNILSARSMDISELHSLESLKLLSITITCESALEDFFSTHMLSCCTRALSLQVFWGSESLDISSAAALEHLFTLEFNHAERLRHINVNFMMDVSFAGLREVNVMKCLNLRYLSWLILAPNLAILRVSFCPEMEEIINIEQLGEISNSDRTPFAKLEVLELESLSKLKSIYWKTLPFKFLKKIKVIDCPLLKKLPLSANGAERFASDVEDFEIIGEEDWWKQVEWEDVATEENFHSFLKTPVVERNSSLPVPNPQISPLPLVERNSSLPVINPQISPLPRRSNVVRSQSDGSWGFLQRFKQHFCGFLFDNKSEA